MSLTMMERAQRRWDRAWGRSARHFSLEDCPGPFGPAFLAWIERVEQGLLIPTAPFKPPESLSPYHLPPLHYWMRRARNSEEDRNENLALFLASLPRLARAGLPIDHAASLDDPDRYASICRRPISHLAMAEDWRVFMPLSFLESLLDSGADPNSRDAFGFPLLGLCSLPGDLERALSAWALLTERGADPNALIPNAQGRGAGVVAGVSQLTFLAAHEPSHLTPRDFARLAPGLPDLYPAIVAREERSALRSAAAGASKGSRRPAL